MATRTLVALVTAVMLVLFLHKSSEAEPKRPPRDVAIEELMLERQMALKQQWESVHATAKNEPIGATEVVVAGRSLFDALIDKRVDRQRRIPILRTYLADLQSLEKVFQVRVDRGTGFPRDLLAVKAERLAAEIELIGAAREDDR